MPNPWETPTFETADSPPETPEEHLEQQEIIGAAQLERANLLRGIFSSRAADLAGNWIPGIDVPKMTIEAALGKTTSGEILSARQRLDYVVIAGGIGLAYALELAGMSGGAVAARSAAGILSKLEFGPALLKEAAQKAETRFPKAAHLLMQAEEFIGSKYEGVMSKVGKEIMTALENLEPEIAM